MCAGHDIGARINSSASVSFLVVYRMWAYINLLGKHVYEALWHVSVHTPLDICHCMAEAMRWILSTSSNTVRKDCAFYLVTVVIDHHNQPLSIEIFTINLHDCEKNEFMIKIDGLGGMLFRRRRRMLTTEYCGLVVLNLTVDKKQLPSNHAYLDSSSKSSRDNPLE